MADLGFHWPSLVVYLVNFTVLLAVLYFFGYKRILAMLDQRSTRIGDSLAEADRVRQDASQARQELETQLDTNRREAQQMMDQARQVAEQFRAEERERARLEAESFLERARQEIQSERQGAVEEVRRQFADLAITAAEQVIERSLDRDAHRELIERVLADGSQAPRG
jgi:F-type H+-transporting ATPase subunit b